MIEDADSLNNYRLCHTFKDKIDRVWKVLTEVEVYYPQLFPDIVSDIQLIKGEKTCEPGCEYSLNWYNESKLIINCLINVKDDFKRKIKWRCYSEELGYSFYITFSCYNNTCQNTTLFIWERNDEGADLKFIEEFNLIRIDMIKRWEEFLSGDTEDLFQFESVIVKCSREEAFKIVSDWGILKNVAPSIADRVKYKGDSSQVGSKFKIYSQKPNGKNMVFKLKVINVETNENLVEWKYQLYCYEGKPRVPQQEIIFSVVKIKENSCFIGFKHIFKQPVKIKVIEGMSAEKRNILKLLKSHLESIDI